MPDHILIVRLRSAYGFIQSRQILRSAVANALVAWPVDGLSLVSIAPVPKDRFIKRRRSPTKRDKLPQFEGF